MRLPYLMNMGLGRALAGNKSEKRRVKNEKRRVKSSQCPFCSSKNLFSIYSSSKVEVDMKIMKHGIKT